MVPSFFVPALRRRACALQRLPGLAALALAALTAQAEAPSRSPRPDPLDPQASVPALRYESSLKPDLRSAADKPLSWREANDTAARIGGWRGYAREAQQPEPVVKPSASAASAAPALQVVPAASAPPVPAMPPGHHGAQRP